LGRHFLITNNAASFEIGLGILTMMGKGEITNLIITNY